MSLRINLNSAAVGTHRVLGANDDNLSRSIERLSSGYKINRAADNPAGLAISEALRAQIGGLKQAIANTQDAVNMVKTAEGALTEVHTLLRSMRDLAVHAQNTGAVDSTQLAADQAQVDSAISALDRIASNTAFGGKKLLDGTAGVTGSVTSGTGATLLNGSDKTAAGTYTITVNTLATQHTYVGEANGVAATVTGTGDVSAGMGGAAGDLVFVDASGNTIATVTFDGTEANQAAINTKINAAFAAVAAPHHVDASSSGNFIKLDQTTTGYEPIIRIGSASTDAVTTKLGFTENTATHGTGFFTSQSSAGTLTLNGVSIAIAANDTSTALVNRINGVMTQTGVTASTTAGGRLTLTANAYGSAAVITASVTGGYTLANLFGTAVDTAGVDSNLTVQRNGGTAVTAAGTGQTWNGVANTDTEGMQLRITATGSKTLVVTNGSLTFQVGSEVGQTAAVAVNGVASTKLGTTATGLETSATSVADIDVTTLAGARDAVRLIDAAIAQVSTQRSSLGSAQKNVFESAINSLGIASENIAASESAIRDTDMAAEMIQFSKSQVLMQATVAMLAQANAAPQALLRLLQ